MAGAGPCWVFFYFSHSHMPISSFCTPFVCFRSQLSKGTEDTLFGKEMEKVIEEQSEWNSNREIRPPEPKQRRQEEVEENLV
jgi:hypothetical protein